VRATARREALRWWLCIQHFLGRGVHTLIVADGATLSLSAVAKPPGLSQYPPTSRLDLSQALSVMGVAFHEQGDINI